MPQPPRLGLVASHLDTSQLAWESWDFLAPVVSTIGNLLVISLSSESSAEAGGTPGGCRGTWLQRGSG